MKNKIILLLSLIGVIGILSTVQFIDTQKSNLKTLTTSTSTNNVAKTEISNNLSSKAEINNDIFNNSVFIGNSYIETLRNYGIIKNVDYFSRVGLTVKTVFTKSTLTGSIPIIDELNNKQYEKIFLLFGENELGWEYPEVFIKNYEKVIDTVKKRQPNAKIYIQSILPITQKESSKNIENTNNTRINEFNKKIKTLCTEKNIIYIDSPTDLKNNSGSLPDDASTDGIHLNKSYCETWINYLKNHI